MVTEFLGKLSYHSFCWSLCIPGAEHLIKGMHLRSLVQEELSMQELGTVGAMGCRSRRLEKLLMLPEPGTSVCMLSQPT